MKKYEENVLRYEMLINFATLLQVVVKLSQGDGEELGERVSVLIDTLYSLAAKVRTERDNSEK